MRHALIPHPSTPCPQVRALSVEIVRNWREILSLRFEIDGDASAIVFPRKAPSRRTNELWKHTCFEAFVSDGAGYHEFNFAPSTEWAAYSFDGYRENMREAEIGTHLIHFRNDERGPKLIAEIDLTPLATLTARDTWRMNITAVIETTDGAKSYWALAHPPGRPDFHHAAGFVLDLPLTEQT
jgi:hypothetical protein